MNILGNWQGDLVFYIALPVSLFEKVKMIDAHIPT